MRAQARKTASADQEVELRALMCLSLEGDKQAYDRLLRKVAEMIKNYLSKSSRVKGGSASVDDLVQDVLLAIHQKKHTYRTELPILPWLFTIARYRLIDSYRASGRQPVIVELDDQIAEYAEFTAGAPDSDQADVEKLLLSLPPKQREVLRLAKIEELPLAEIGLKMNMSLSSVKVTVHRALQSLRKKHNVTGEESNEEH